MRAARFIAASLSLAASIPLSDDLRAEELGAETETSTAAEVQAEWLELARTASTSTSAASALTETATAAIPEPAPPGLATVRLVYTGGSCGIRSGRYELELPERIHELTALKSIVAHHAVLVQGVSVLIAEDRRVATLVDLLDRGPPVCGPPRPGLSIRSPRERLLYSGELDRYPAWIARLQGGITRREYEARRCTNASGAAAILWTPARATFTPPNWALEEFEFRLGLHLQLEHEGRIEHADIAGIPEGEPARRFHLASTLARAPDALYVDAGSFLDGASSINEGELSAHRPLGLEMLERLEPAALVPGETELLAGARWFLEEARAHHLQYVATNWTAADPALELPEYLVRDVSTPEDAVRIAFLGVVDPRIGDRVVGLAGEGITIEDPVASVQRTIRALREAKVQPDLIVVFTIADIEVTEAIEEQVRGIDLIAGDLSRDSERVRRIEIELRADGDDRRPAAAVLPIYGTTVADLTFSNRTLVRARVQPQRTTERLEADRRTLATVTRTRAKLYPQLDRPLLAAPAGGPLARLGPDEWRRLVCEAVLAGTGADVVLLPRLPRIDRLPGPLTELLVADRLATLDKLETHQIPGAKMLELLRQAGDVVPTSCGAGIGARVLPIVRGRAIDPELIYRVVTTDRARVLGLAKLFEAAYSKRAYDPRGPEPIRDDGGVQVSLRRAVLERLRALREVSGGELAPIEPLAIDSAVVSSAMWMLRLSRVSFRAERFQGADDAAFSRVPETLATSPSSLSLGVDVDLSLVHDSARFLFDLRARSQYSRLAVSGAEVQEPSDDLRISSSASIPAVALVMGPVKLMPFTEVLLDSEITPVEREGMELPRQMDLSLTFGASVVPFSFIRVARAGAFVLRDLARSERPIEAGGRAELSALVIFGPELRFEATADATLYADSQEDDASDLRFKSLIETRLALPLVRWLDAGLFARAFIFHGRVPETDLVRASYLAGFSLDVHGLFRL